MDQISFFLFLAAPGGLWDLSSLTRDRTYDWKCGILTTGVPGNSLTGYSIMLCDIVIK